MLIFKHFCIFHNAFWKKKFSPNEFPFVFWLEQTVEGKFPLKKADKYKVGHMPLNLSSCSDIAMEKVEGFENAVCKQTAGDSPSECPYWKGASLQFQRSKNPQDRRAPWKYSAAALEAA